MPNISNESSLTYLPYLYVNGCNISFNYPFQVIISKGQLRDSTNSVDIVVNDPIVIDTTVVGVGGLDSGSIQNSFYAVYVIGDTSGVNTPSGIISLSPNSPYMPSVDGVTYSVFRLVGYIYIQDSMSKNIFPCTIFGNDNYRTHFWNDIFFLTPLVTTPSPDYQVISCSSFIPTMMFDALVDQPTIKAIFLASIGTMTTPGAMLEIQSANSLDSSGRNVSASTSVVGPSTLIEIECPADYIQATDSLPAGYAIRCRNTAADGSAIYIIGFRYVI